MILALKPTSENFLLDPQRVLDGPAMKPRSDQTPPPPRTLLENKSKWQKLPFYPPGSREKVKISALKNCRATLG